MRVPFFRPDIGDAEVEEVAAVLRSGWLTTGPRVERFERAFADAVGAEHAVALSSGTAALHLAVHGMSLSPGQAVLVPTLTFAATAEVVAYCGAVPVLVDCEPETLNLDLEDAARKIAAVRDGSVARVLAGTSVVGVIPVHVGGSLVDPERLDAFATAHGLWVVEDAAHAFTAGWRQSPEADWTPCGSSRSAAVCFSFYANKPITTGEGGMLVTDDAGLAEAVRRASLHGLSSNTWTRQQGAAWDYRIVAPGFKYNMSDLTAAVGLHQLQKADRLRDRRDAVADYYRRELGSLGEVELPATSARCRHSWHLFTIRLKLDRLTIDRARFITELADRGVGSAVAWRPLHLHPYYLEACGWSPGDCPVATAVWERLVSLPLFPSMTTAERSHVVETVAEVCRRFRR